MSTKTTKQGLRNLNLVGPKPPISHTRVFSSVHSCSVYESIGVGYDEDGREYDFRYCRVCERRR